MPSSSSSSPEIHGASSDGHFSYKYATHDEVLEDLSSRFILNLPDDELSSLERICFQVEQAHWFYEDFIREENPKFPSLPLKKFSAMLFHACPLLHQWSHDHEQAFDNFMQYKIRVPVCGAIMLNDTWEKCLLVKGWRSSSGWGFPKGKINEIEPPASCAIREVLEETGYNITGKINPEDVIEMTIKEQKISLFIVPGVPEDYPFKTKTRKEISKIEWFKLTDLPTWKRNRTAAGRFYLISPFIGPLKLFIHERKPMNNRKKSPNTRRLMCIQPRRNLTCDTHHSGRQTQSLQSSSAESGETEPQTPLYAEAQTNISLITNEDPLAAGESVVAMDHHFSRLLSGLSVSAPSDEEATTSVDGRTSTQPQTKYFGQLGTLNKASTSVAHCQSMIKSSPAVPLTVREGETSESASGSKLGAPYNTLSSDPFDMQPSIIPISPRLEPKTVRDASKNVHAFRRTSLNAATTSSPMTTHRTPSNPDISPYLSRTSVPLVPSANKMKHIALLEAASAESARLMDAYKSAAAEGRPIDVNDNFKHSVTPSLSSVSSITNRNTCTRNTVPIPITQPVAGFDHLVPCTLIDGPSLVDTFNTSISGPYPSPRRSRTSLTCQNGTDSVPRMADTGRNYALSTFDDIYRERLNTPIPYLCSNFPATNGINSTSVSLKPPSSNTLLSILQNAPNSLIPNMPSSSNNFSSDPSTR